MTKQAFQAIKECLLARYPGNFHSTIAVREFLEQICKRHLDLDLGDTDLARKLCSGDEPRYWQQLSEILLGHELLEAGLLLRPSHEGPDFLIPYQDRKIWIEVICPRPEGIPPEWLMGKGNSMPHEAMLLRWTAAIKEKAEKLLGNSVSGAKGYIQKGIVGTNDIYVVAVNARLLRGPNFASVTGISQLPFAAEAVFAIGPYAVNISRDTLEVVSSSHQHRPMIKKPNGAQVSANTFLDPAYRPISAIWATDIDESWVIGNTKSMAVIHNPEAVNPLPLYLLPSHEEYVATLEGIDAYRLDQLNGRLKSGFIG